MAAVVVSACAIAFPPTLYAVAIVSVGDGLPKLLWPALGPIGLLGAQTWLVICEEPGWRGFAWPRLRVQLGPLTAAFSLGLIWATWHLPMFFVQDSRQQGSFAEFAVIVVSWTLIMGALLGRSSGSFLPALLFHAAANICAYVFELSERADARASALWIAAGAIAAIDLRRFESAPRNTKRARDHQ